ncbi:Vacuolar sorting protein [Mycena indigotica]|uniref:Vacuolar-sorting protein SNF7 n=1 Tax=Mycena indigotica TaxID=2126181 RepID=A0A8H6S2B9_9AGAR|nr:Vacuolar sorting protein [Mycena indigotica]KAF7291388.1 Vacuolar sorting protein [Mycena indigotica]
MYCQPVAMAGLLSYFGRPDTKQAARDAIVRLRETVHLLEKKEAHLQKEIDEQLRIAKANVVANKALATRALKRKRLKETQLEQFRGQQLQIQMQIDTLESVHINKATVRAMKGAAEVLQSINKKMTVADVDRTMADIAEQREVAYEISALISTPVGVDTVDEDDLLLELAELEDDVITERLAAASHAPLYHPDVGSVPMHAALPNEEEEILRQLQADMTALY